MTYASSYCRAQRGISLWFLPGAGRVQCLGFDQGNFPRLAPATATRSGPSMPRARFLAAPGMTCNREDSQCGLPTTPCDLPHHGDARLSYYWSSHCHSTSTFRPPARLLGFACCTILATVTCHRPGISRLPEQGSSSAWAEYGPKLHH